MNQHYKESKQYNLPMSYTYKCQGTYQASHHLGNSVSTFHHSNLNLSPVQKELLQGNHRLGHMGFKKIQFLMRTGVLPNTEAKSLHTSACKLTTYPLCAACQFGKQRQRPSPGKRSSVVMDVQGNLKKNKLFPGQCIAVDHYICSTKGRLSFQEEEPRIYWRSTLHGHELQMSGKCVSATSQHS